MKNKGSINGKGGIIENLSVHRWIQCIQHNLEFKSEWFQIQNSKEKVLLVFVQPLDFTNWMFISVKSKHKV